MEQDISLQRFAWITLFMLFAPIVAAQPQLQQTVPVSWDVDGDGDSELSDNYVVEWWLGSGGNLECLLDAAVVDDETQIHDVTAIFETLYLFFGPGGLLSGNQAAPFLLQGAGAGTTTDYRFELCTFTRGDAQRDGDVDLPDAMFILNYALSQTQEVPKNLDSADVNDDGVVTFNDGNYLLNYLFLGGAAPPAPFSLPGFDPTPDLLMIQCEAGFLTDAVAEEIDEIAETTVPLDVVGMRPSAEAYFLWDVDNDGWEEFVWRRANTSDFFALSLNLDDPSQGFEDDDFLSISDPIMAVFQASSGQAFLLRISDSGLLEVFDSGDLTSPAFSDQVPLNSDDRITHGALSITDLGLVLSSSTGRIWILREGLGGFPTILLDELSLSILATDEYVSQIETGPLQDSLLFTTTNGRYILWDATATTDVTGMFPALSAGETFDYVTPFDLGGSLVYLLGTYDGSGEQTIRILDWNGVSSALTTSTLVGVRKPDYFVQLQAGEIAFGYPGFGTAPTWESYAVDGSGQLEPPVPLNTSQVVGDLPRLRPQPGGDDCANKIKAMSTAPDTAENEHLRKYLSILRYLASLDYEVAGNGEPWGAGLWNPAAFPGTLEIIADLLEQLLNQGEIMIGPTQSEFDQQHPNNECNPVNSQIPVTTARPVGMLAEVRCIILRPFGPCDPDSNDFWEAFADLIHELLHARSAARDPGVHDLGQRILETLLCHWVQGRIPVPTGPGIDINGDGMSDPVPWPTPPLPPGLGEPDGLRNGKTFTLIQDAFYRGPTCLRSLYDALCLACIEKPTPENEAAFGAAVGKFLGCLSHAIAGGENFVGGTPATSISITAPETVVTHDPDGSGPLPSFTLRFQCTPDARVVFEFCGGSTTLVKP